MQKPAMLWLYVVMVCIIRHISRDVEEGGAGPGGCELKGAQALSSSADILEVKD